MSVIRTGVFFGLWHGQPASFNVQQVFQNGGFNGVASFTGGPFQGFQFGFAGTVANDGSLYITRDTGTGTQSVHAGPPQFANGQYVWHGITTGVGIPPQGLPFALHVPALIKVGSFSGEWHGQPVTFSVQQVFGNGAFNGVGVFIGGPFQGTQFGFAGITFSTGALHMTRDTGTGLQVADAGPPQQIGNEMVWHGTTTGVGIQAQGLPFSLHVPV